jgi:U3 small nucleolar ribonucleoprotein protein IMP4
MDGHQSKMLITTSRKPSPRSRTFSKNLGRILNTKYINRGKMSIRDTLIKSKVMGYNRTAVISEMKGNPSRMDIYDSDGELKISLHISVSNPIASGRIDSKKLHLKWELDNLEDLKEELISNLEIPEYEEAGSKEQAQSEQTRRKNIPNLLIVKEGAKSRALLEFYDQNGQIIGSKIYIHHYKLGGDVNSS